MSIEREIWGVLSQAEYGRLENVLADRHGLPRRQRRLALQATDYSRHDLDTRIRITDGFPALIQKHGNWNADQRQEIEVPLPKDASFIASLYEALGNMLNGPSVRKNIIQIENLLFDGDGVEIKLTCQAGLETAYSYEIEQTDGLADVVARCRELGLEPDLTYKDEAYWSKYNQRVNLPAASLSFAELESLITAYL